MPSTTLRIERKREDTPQAAATLRQVLQQKHLFDVTAADAAAASGLPLQHCTEALMLLARHYHARVRVSEAGTLRFTFKTLKAAKPRAWHQVQLARVYAWRKRHALVLRAMGAGLVAPPVLLALGFNALGLYEATTLDVAVPPVAVAVGCFLAGLSVTLAMLTMAFNPLVCLAETLFFGLAIGPLHTWLAMGWYLGGYLLMVRVSMRIGRFFRPEYLKARDAKRGRKEVDVVAIANTSQDWVRGFLFGPAPLPHGPLTEERRLTASIVKHGGVLTLGDLMGLFGWEYETAMGQLPRLLLDYGGELVVTEEGALVCRFDALGADFAHGHYEADLRPWHLREAAPPRYWGCPPWAAGMVFGAIAVACLGLLLDPALKLFPGPHTWAREATEDFLRVYIQGFGLYAYMLLLLPLAVRLPGWFARLRAYQADGGLRAALALLVDAPGGRLIEGVDRQALVRLKGEIDLERSEGKRLWVWFPLEASARKASAGWQRRPNPADEAIAFDTGA